MPKYILVPKQDKFVWWFIFWSNKISNLKSFERFSISIKNTILYVLSNKHNINLYQ